MDAAADPLDGFAVGRRVSLRHRLGDGRATDVIGLIETLDDTAVSLTDRAQVLHRVERSAVVAVRAVPVARGPHPARADVRTLELIAADSWQDQHEPLGEWRLRYAGGATNRANSCLAVGEPGRPLAEAVAAITDFAERHGIPPQVQAVVDSPEELTLRGLGWLPIRTDVSVLVARLVDLCGTRTGAAVVTGELTDDWFARYRDDHPSGAADEQLRRLLLSGRTVFATRHLGVDLVAMGRASLSQDWVTLFGLWTDPDQRRQGLMRDTIRSLCWWGADRGARSVQLQVDTANTGALAAYDRLGFVHHHNYRYLVPPS